MVERNIIMGKAGGTAGKNSVNYKISLPADMVKELGEKHLKLVTNDGIIILSGEASKSDNNPKGRKG